MKTIVIKKCVKCGALVEVLRDCTCNNCGIKCCGETMVELKSNSVDASFEKHVPTYEVKNGRIYAKVNHVMDADHYIEWLAFVSDGGVERVCFAPGQKAEASFEYRKGVLYSYCNKHALWQADVK